MAPPTCAVLFVSVRLAMLSVIPFAMVNIEVPLCCPFIMVLSWFSPVIVMFWLMFIPDSL
jgi:hypothetical protein